MNSASVPLISLKGTVNEMTAPEKPAFPAGPAAARAGSRKKAYSRHGKIRIEAYLHPDFKDSIRLVQALTGENLRETIARAFNTLFIEYNVPVVEEGTSERD